MNALWRLRRSKRYAVRSDEGAPGEVTQAQLDELHIAVVKSESN